MELESGLGQKPTRGVGIREPETGWKLHLDLRLVESQAKASLCQASSSLARSSASRNRATLHVTQSPINQFN